MRVAFTWTGITATMVDAWRQFASAPENALKLFLDMPSSSDTAYRIDELTRGLDCEIHTSGERLDRGRLIREAVAFEPDLLVVLGWRSEVSRAIAEAAELSRVPKVFAFDMPFAWTARKLAARYVLRGYLRRFVGAFVTGERSAAYARYLGFPEGAIEPGLFGMDTKPFAEKRLARTEADRYPRQFLYVGRYAREKRIDLLVAAYEQYRRSVSDPWGLSCAGLGPHATLLSGREGVADHGFVQPAELPSLFARHGAFVIASDYDPWPMVVAQACASGMPVVCTAACGSSVELVRSYWNGRVCGTGSAESLAAGLRWIHAHAAEIPVMGRRGQQLVEPYSAAAWAARLQGLCERFARQA